MISFNFKTKSGNKKFKTAHHTRIKKNMFNGTIKFSLQCAGYLVSIRQLNETPLSYWKTRLVEI